MSGLDIFVHVVDGNLERIGFSTAGYGRQDATLDSLKLKYGPPTTVMNIAKQNQMGASFSSLFASWHFDNFDVMFQGMTDRVDSGLVNIDTPKGIQAREAISKQLQAGQPNF